MKRKQHGKRLCGLLALLCAATATADPAPSPAPWAPAEKRWLAAAELALLMDMGQTLEISRSCRGDGRYYELNPILGRCPSQAAVVGYFVAAGVGAWLLADRLPPVWRRRFLVGLTVLEVGVVGHNASIGIRVRF